METSSRRAFALDSRTVWVEQQLIKSSDTIVAKDNFVLGPGEYHVRIPERHVSTPTLGRQGGHFSPFKSKLKISTPASRPYSRGASPPKSASYPKRDNSGNREFNTVYHAHDDRVPFDPKSGITPTPAPQNYNVESGILKYVNEDGVHKTKNTLPFGPSDVPFGDRNRYKEALPCYDVNYDSLQVKPTPKLTTFSRDKRIDIPLNEHNDNNKKVSTKRGKNDKKKSMRLPLEDGDQGDNNYSAAHGSVSPTGEAGKARRAKRQQQKEEGLVVPPGTAFNQGCLSGTSLFQARCNSVPLPKLKCRAPPTLIFNASSYRTPKDRQPVSLTPNVVKQMARVNLFNKYYVIPREHQSSQVSHESVAEQY